jgi:hypothetical protein
VGASDAARPAAKRDEEPVARCRNFRRVTPRCAGLLLAVCAVLSGSAFAQTAPTPSPDPLAPKLDSDPRNPPRFRTFDRPATAQLGPGPNFVPPASGAGNTGFDSTNSRKAKAGKAKPKSASPNNSPAVAQPNDQTVAPGTPAPLAVSPYQKPAAGSAAYAAAPGAPPVELGPVRTAAKKRKAHADPEDPYAALGVKAGAFNLYPAVEVIGGHDSNPGRVQGGQGASLYTVAPELQVQSDWSRHELKADLRGSYNGFSPDQTPTLTRPYFNGKVDGRVDVTKDTHILLDTRGLVSTDNPGSPNLQAGLAQLPVFTTVGGSAGIDQRFNRFDLTVKGDAERTVYQNSKLTDGTTASNADRAFDQYGGTLRGGYELTPGVTPFVEVGADTRVHDLNVDFSGYQRNSNGTTGLLGTSFDLSKILTGEVAVGYTQRIYQDPRLTPIKGLVGDASLIWTANALTKVTLTGKSAVGEVIVPGVSGALYRDVGLQLDHSFRDWLIGTVKLGFGLDDYVGYDREDHRYSAGIGLTYKLNRTTQLKGEVRQDWLHSNVTGNDYTATIMLLGLRLQY